MYFCTSEPLVVKKFGPGSLSRGDERGGFEAPPPPNTPLLDVAAHCTLDGLVRDGLLLPVRGDVSDGDDGGGDVEPRLSLRLPLVPAAAHDGYKQHVFELN